MDIICPNGHHSTTSDNCSECGAKIIEIPVSTAVIPKATASGYVPLAEDLPHVPPAVAAAAGGFTSWAVVVSVDGSLYTHPIPNVPLPDQSSRTYPLDLSDSLIGRRSDRQEIFPEISVKDPAVSHRHAKLLREKDGSLFLMDVGSTNGTFLNGASVPASVRVPVTDGDQITLGSWTRIVSRGKKS
jgi:hypothetical protein